jgi:fructose-1,6-bisphosphatase/inositol monophosphatase family enzyme
MELPPGAQGVPSLSQNYGYHVLQACARANSVYHQLAAAGLDTSRTNQFGESALTMDVKAEEAIIEYCQLAKLPIRIISEEHGTLDLVSNPSLLGVIDGIDGTALYRSDWQKGEFGTMFGIFESTNPRYMDYLACAVMQHGTGRLFVVEKDQGSAVLLGIQREALTPSKAAELSRQSTIYYSTYPENPTEETIFAPIVKNFQHRFLPCLSKIYLDIAMGKAELMLEFTHKQNLEQMIAYGILREAGAVFTDHSGRDIGDQYYLEFGQKKPLPLIVAANAALASWVARKIC